MRCNIRYETPKECDDYYPLRLIADEDMTITIEPKNTVKGSSLQIFRGKNPHVRLSEVLIDENKSLILILDCDPLEGGRGETLKEKLKALEETKVFPPFFISVWKKGKKISRSEVSKNKKGKGILNITNEVRGDDGFWQTVDRLHID